METYFWDVREVIYIDSLEKNYRIDVVSYYHHIHRIYRNCPWLFYFQKKSSSSKLIYVEDLSKPLFSIAEIGNWVEL